MSDSERRFSIIFPKGATFSDPLLSITGPEPTQVFCFRGGQAAKERYLNLLANGGEVGIAPIVDPASVNRGDLVVNVNGQLFTFTPLE